MYSSRRGSMRCQLLSIIIDNPKIMIDFSIIQKKKSIRRGINIDSRYVQQCLSLFFIGHQRKKQKGRLVMEDTTSSIRTIYPGIRVYIRQVRCTETFDAISKSITPGTSVPKARPHSMACCQTVLIQGKRKKGKKNLK